MSVQHVLATEVRRRLEEAKVRQRDLAADVGISEKHLSQMLTGKVAGSLKTWNKLLEALSRYG